MNATNTNAGGWEKSELRKEMNSGEIRNLMPSDFQSKVKTVRKLTNNVGGNSENKDAAVTATVDRLFLLSYSEIVETPWNGWYDWCTFSWIGKEGTQYEAFEGKVTENHSDNSAIIVGDVWWERSAHPNYSDAFLNVGFQGNPTSGTDAKYSRCVCPAWCF